MEPVAFPEQNIVFAKNQPPYLPLPAFADHERTISSWRLSWRERIVLLITGRLWLHQMNFGQRLQPQCPSVDYPFETMTGD